MKGYGNIRRIICFMLACPVLVGLFGCGKAKKMHTADDIVSFNIICGHMNYYASYNFDLKNDNGIWLFSARCFTDPNAPRVEFEDVAVTDEDVNELLNIIRDEETIVSILKYREPLFNPVIKDATMYNTYIRFADGVSSKASIHSGNAIEQYFYRLTAKYSVTEE